MKAFIKNLLSSSDNTSHKRVIALSAFVVLVAMVIAKFFNAPLDENLIYVFAGLVAGQSGLSVIEKAFNKPKL